MVLPPLEQLPVGMPASLTGAFQTAEQRRDYQTYLLVARNELKKALAAPPPRDPGAAYRAFKQMYPDDEPPVMGYNSVEYHRGKKAMAVPPPNLEDVRTYEEVLLPTYNARRSRLAANLESVENELPRWLSEGYQRMLQDLLE